MQIKPLVVLKGMATLFPGVVSLACSGSGGTDSPRYCYAVWLRHLVKLAECGVPTDFRTVAELGPGDSLGIGLSAMLTGADRYFAFDLVSHSRTATNLRTLDALVPLFERCAPIPGQDEFREIGPDVGSSDFPGFIVDEQRRLSAIRPERVRAIREAIRTGSGDGVEFRYAAPWIDSSIIRADSIDLALSQAVLEHVDDIDTTYQALFRWLRPGGVTSHQIDFTSHGLTRDWYGHWTVSSPIWSLMRGRRPYFINRLPASAHREAMRRAGFEVVLDLPTRAEALPRESLASEFRHFTEEDLHTNSLFVIARKPGHS
jgi:SAM-dependent methyltransferase